MLHELALGFLVLFLLAIVSKPLGQVLAFFYLAVLTIIGIMVYPFFKLNEFLNKRS